MTWQCVAEKSGSFTSGFARNLFKQNYTWHSTIFVQVTEHVRHQFHVNQHFVTFFSHVGQFYSQSETYITVHGLFHFLFPTRNDSTETYYVIKIHKIYEASSSVWARPKGRKKWNEKIVSFSYKFPLVLLLFLSLGFTFPFVYANIIFMFSMWDLKRKLGWKLRIEIIKAFNLTRF